MNGATDRHATAATTRLLSLASCLGLALAVHANPAAAQPGPDACEPCSCADRGTLLQWSYGTSFSGGPDLSEPITTDRPDFTESSVTVGRGVTQLEMDYTYANDRGPDSSFDGHSYPSLLVRQGLLADWFEFRLAWTCLSERERVGNVVTTSNRSSDLLVGAKIALTPQEGLLPEMAIIPQAFLPISSDQPPGGGEVLLGVVWIYAWELSDRVSTAGQTQLLRTLDDATGESFGLYSQSWVVGLSLTERLGSYAEWFALVPDGADTNRTQQYFNGGFTYLLTHDIQLDVRAGVGLNAAADDFFVGSGLSVRFR